MLQVSAAHHVRFSRLGTRRDFAALLVFSIPEWSRTDADLFHEQHFLTLTLK